MLTAPEHTEQRLGIDLQLADLESFRGNYSKALAIPRPARKKRARRGTSAFQATVLGQLGRVAMWQGDPNTGLKHVGEALELSRRTGDRVALYSTCA